MKENTVQQRYALKSSSATRLEFNQVRIQLYDERGSAMDAKRLVNQLRKFIKAQPYGIVSKDITRGLGNGIIILGEK